MPISVQCDCGKHLRAKDDYAGRVLKCPGCGDPVRVPATNPLDNGFDLQNQTADVTSEAFAVTNLQPSFPQVGLDDDASTKPPDRAKAGGSREWIMWSGLAACLAVVALGLVLFLNKQRRDAANGEVLDLMTAAKIAANDKRWDDAIASVKLAMEVRNSTENDAAQLLPTIQEAKAVDQADHLFKTALASVQNGKFTEATQFLRTYLANPHTTHSAKANHLLDDLDLASSDTRAADLLSHLTDEDFDYFDKTGKLNRLSAIDSKPLRGAAEETLRKCVPQVRSERLEMKQRQAEANALAERQRAAAAHKENEARLQRILDGTEDGEVVVRYKDNTIKETGWYRQGRKDGLWMEHVGMYSAPQYVKHKAGEDDKLDELTVGLYRGGAREGLWVATKEGQVVSTNDYNDGLLHGFSISYKNGGQPAVIAERRNSQMEGFMWVLPHPGDTEEARFGSWTRFSSGQPIEFAAGPPSAYQRIRLEDAVKKHALEMGSILKK